MWQWGIVDRNDEGCPMTGGSTVLGCPQVNVISHFRPTTRPHYSSHNVGSGHISVT
jgi:hypothetical protein